MTCEQTFSKYAAELLYNRHRGRQLQNKFLDNFSICFPGQVCSVR